MANFCVTGGRDYNDAQCVERILSSIFDIGDVLGVGDADGLDKLARQWALARRVQFFEFTAQWSNFGRAAGPMRNRAMLDEMKPTMLIAFPGGRGTADCIRAAEERGIPVWCIP